MLVYMVCNVHLYMYNLSAKTGQSYKTETKE
jgi:hypothetical protein